MKYFIHNVKDSCWNILGAKYSVYEKDSRGETNASEVIEADYDIGFHHISTVLKCVEWAMRDAAKSDSVENMEISFKLYDWKKSMGEYLK